MKKKCFLLIAFFLFAALNMPLTAFAITRSSAGWQDVNRPIGDPTIYTLDVPMNWRRHVSAIRIDYVTHPENIAERVIFHYNPASASLSSAVLLEFVVFARGYWNENSDHIMVTDSYSHIFTIRPAQNNPYVFGSDRLIFDSLLREASNPAFLANYISVPIGRDAVVRNTVSVNGVRMNSPSHTNVFRVVSVPLREVAEALGYRVVWDSATGNVTVSSGTFHTTLGGNINVAQRHNITNINGISYVSTMFFLQVMGCNVEIDEHNNVRITRT